MAPIHRRGVAIWSTVNAVGVEEIPQIIAGVTVRKKDVQVGIRPIAAAHAATTARTGIARPAEHVARLHGFANQARDNFLELVPHCGSSGERSDFFSGQPVSAR